MNDITGHHRPTFSLILRLLIFTIGVGFSFLEISLLLLLLAGSLLFPAGNALAEVYPLLNAAVMIVVVGCLMAPGLVFSLFEAFHSNIHSPVKRFSNRLTFPNLLFVVWLVMMGAAFLLLRFLPAAQWLLPFLQIPAILIPIFWLYRISTRSMESTQTKRNWTLLGLNLGLQPVVVVVLELGALLAMSIIGIILISMQPGLVNTITHQLEQLALTDFNIETIDRILTPYLEKPAVLFTILVFIAGIVPLLEELVKPILVLRWFKKPLSPSQGFLIGLIGGSAFALWESMSALGNTTADTWFFVVIARYGTSILHMSTAALMGWAWMKSFRDHRFSRTAGIYLLVVALHGGWNFFTMLQAFTEFSVTTNRFPLNLAPIAPIVMVTIVLLGLGVLLFGGNRIVREQKDSCNTVDPALASPENKSESPLS